MRTLTYWLYFSAIATAVVLSERAVGVRAAAAGVWIVGCLGAVVWAAGRQVSAWRARRGWVWLASGLCSRCAYPVNRSFVQCPECGGRVGAPPNGHAVRRMAGEGRAGGAEPGSEVSIFLEIPDAGVKNTA